MELEKMTKAELVNEVLRLKDVSMELKGDKVRLNAKCNDLLKEKENQIETICNKQAIIDKIKASVETVIHMRYADYLPSQYRPHKLESNLDETKKADLRFLTRLVDFTHEYQASVGPMLRMDY